MVRFDGVGFLELCICILRISKLLPGRLVTIGCSSHKHMAEDRSEDLVHVIDRQERQHVRHQLEHISCWYFATLQPPRILSESVRGS